MVPRRKSSNELLAEVGRVGLAPGADLFPQSLHALPDDNLVSPLVEVFDDPTHQRPLLSLLPVQVHGEAL